MVTWDTQRSHGRMSEEGGVLSDPKDDSMGSLSGVPTRVPSEFVVTSVTSSPSTPPFPFVVKSCESKPDDPYLCLNRANTSQLHTVCAMPQQERVPIY
jgi:hypothetical protein